METIAVCITTRNRPEIFEAALGKWQKFLPENSQIIIVDDASINPFWGIDYGFLTQQGIAKAKNKCLELAQNFDHIFLVDDDVYPKVVGWEKPYIESGVNHLCLTFEKNAKGIYYSPSIRKADNYNGLISYTAPNGCFLYLRKVCLEIAGGMRPEFGLWGFEHVEYSSRIHALGLTPKPFLDIPNSLDLIEVLDYSNAVQSSLSNDEKRKDGAKNLKVYEQYAWSKEYVPFV